LSSLLFAAGTGVSLLNFVLTRRGPKNAPANPWHADSLEWSTTSPPPHYNFARIPVVASRHPLWDQHPIPEAESGPDEDTRSLGMAGAVARETPITSGVDTRPEGTLRIPTETYVPLACAFAIVMVFVGLLVAASVIAILAIVGIAVAVLWWTWQTEEDLK
jgi:cytochrome c oxidase subunit 1/cytochrome c oxidase subunit I+III